MRVMDKLEDCGDNSCIFGAPGGMGTNGGCRCFSDMPHNSEARRSRRLIQRNIMKIKAEVDELESKTVDIIDVCKMSPTYVDMTQPLDFALDVVRSHDDAMERVMELTAENTVLRARVAELEATYAHDNAQWNFQMERMDRQLQAVAKDRTDKALENTELRARVAELDDAKRVVCSAGYEGRGETGNVGDDIRVMEACFRGARDRAGANSNEAFELRARVTELEGAVGDYLSDVGACANDGDEHEDTLCNLAGCLYCAMARVQEGGP